MEDKSANNRQLIIKVIAKTRKGKWVWIWCEVEPAAPHKITGFRLEPTAPPDGQQ